MLQELTEDHRLTEAGDPDGGTTTGPGFSIEWAGPHGFTPDDEPQGALPATVIAAAASRLEHLQARHPGAYTQAIEHLDAAMAALHRGT